MDIPIFSPVVTFAEAAPGWPGLLLSLCFFGVFAVFIVKQAFGSGPFKQLLAAFNRLPRSLQMAVLAVVVAGVVIGGGKPEANSPFSFLDMSLNWVAFNTRFPAG